MALQKTIEKDDLLTRMRVREVALFGLIAMAAILAQLPHEVLEDYGINRNYLLGVLGCGIILGLFFYLKFFFFLAVVLLILGANLDQQLAEYINISRPAPWRPSRRRETGSFGARVLGNRPGRDKRYVAVREGKGAS